MSRTLNIHAVKTHLSKIIESVEQGEVIVIARAGKPVAQITAVDLPQPRPGLWKGKVQIADNFDEPMPEEWLAEFEQSPLLPLKKGTQRKAVKR